MAHDQKYGKLDIPGVPEDMPVIVFLAKDKLAPIALDAYKNACELMESLGEVPANHVGGIRKVTQVFDDYPVDSKKFPD